MENEAFYNARKLLGLNRAALARELGMSPTTISAYETGRHKVPAHVWLAIKTRKAERVMENLRIIMENYENSER